MACEPETGTMRKGLPEKSVGEEHSGRAKSTEVIRTQEQAGH